MLLSDVCLSHTSGLTREERDLGRRKSAVVVSVGTYLVWKRTATLRLLGSARGPGHPRGRRGAGAYCVATCTACY